MSFLKFFILVMIMMIYQLRKYILILVIILLAIFVMCKGPWTEKGKIKSLYKNKKYEQAAHKGWDLYLKTGDKDIYDLLKTFDECEYKMIEGYLFKAADKQISTENKIPLSHYGRNIFLVVPNEYKIEQEMWELAKKQNKKKFLGVNYGIDYSTCLELCIDSLKPRFTYEGIPLRSFNAKDESICFLTHELVKKKFPDTDLSSSSTGLFLIDQTNNKNLIPANQYNRKMYKAKIGAFCNLCQYYGAKKVTVLRIETADNAIVIKQNAPKTEGQSHAKRKVSWGKTYSELFECKNEFKGEKGTGEVPHSVWDSTDFKYFLDRCKSSNKLKSEQVTFEYTEDIGLSLAFLGELPSVWNNTNQQTEQTDKKLKVNAGKFLKYYCTYTVTF